MAGQADGLNAIGWYLTHLGEHRQALGHGERHALGDPERHAVQHAVCDAEPERELEIESVSSMPPRATFRRL